METGLQFTQCPACGKSLPQNHVGSCPKCGNTRKTVNAHIIDTLHFRECFQWEHIREYYERHWILLSIVLAVTVGSPFLGLFLAGWPGVVVGLIIAVITYFLGPQAVTKVREIQKEHAP